ncbi:RNA depended RNA polymerase [Paralichthys olivaceus birnavirus]|uniref:RNA-directed RNA polymerase n=1 Tax=Paralichthys olivaceus birnavirus TaxID=475879 RepID=A8IFB1_9VIRU|nr:RNA depended RNA polymerase [Paralichthys olivaceus birnavirus]
MSDIFNSPQNKASILSALMKSTAGDVEDVLIPKRFRPAKDPLDSPQAAAQFLKDNKYRILRPRAIPTMVELETDAALPRLRQMVDDGKLKDTVSVPEGTTAFYPKYYPFHKPDHDEVGTFGAPDVTLLKQLTFFLLENDFPTGPETLRQVREAIATLQYGSGSYSGQLNRLLAMKGVATGRNPNKTPKTVGYSNEQLAKLLEQTLPINPPKNEDPDLRWAPSWLINYTGDQSTDKSYLPHVTVKSSAGLPYIGKTKGDTTAEALVLADSFIRDLGKAATSADPGTEVKKTITDFWYLSCGLLFPKGERYTQVDWDKKTRNIWSAPYPTHLLLSMVSSPVMEESKLNITNTQTPSLYGFSPFHGGMDRIMTIIRNSLDTGEDLVMIYADNIYILQDDTWYSIDLEKGEANCTPQHMQAMMYYLLTRGWTNEDGSPRYNPTWATFAMNVAPSMVVDSSCLLMNLQLKTYGQGSGNAFTFLNNHLMSTIVVAEWVKAGKPNPMTKEFMDLEEKTGINFKIERELKNLREVIMEAVETAPQDGYLADGSDLPPHKPGRAVELDLLGWSAVYSRRMEMFVPVLENERLIASAAYPKGLENKTLARKPGAEIAYQIVRYEAIRLVGGWNNPLLETAAKHMSLDKRKRLEVKGIDVTGFLDDWNNMSEFGGDLEGITLAEPLTNQTLIDINTPLESFDPKERPETPRSPKKTLDEVTAAITSGTYKDPKSAVWRLLDQRTKLRVSTLRDQAAALRPASSTVDNWAEATEELAAQQQLLMKANTLLKSSLTETREALETVQSDKIIAGKSNPEKNPGNAANPVVGYGEFSEKIPLTPTQKKNAKRREKQRRNQ